MNDGLSQRNASLYKFWEQAKPVLGGSRAAASPDEWNEQVYHLSTCGKGIEEALKFLYSKQPSYEIFMDWLQPANPTNEIESTVQTDTVLTEEDWHDWDTNGYIVIKNAVPGQRCAAARDAIWAYLGADPTIPASWYLPHEGKNGMMLGFFHHEALNRNRNSAKIRKAYEELYKGIDIYLLVDKVSFNPPETTTHRFNGSPLHWDVSLQLPVPFVLQGLLYLTDVDAGDGAFHCVPGFHKQIDHWINSLPGNTDPRSVAQAELEPIAVPGNAGDLVIWHQALPHCASPNKGSLPRMVQYIAYKPVKTEEHTVWK